jgi:hypothetical protein
VLKAGSVPSSPHNSVVLEIKAHLGSNLGLGSASHIKIFLGIYLSYVLKRVYIKVKPLLSFNLFNTSFKHDLIS